MFIGLGCQVLKEIRLGFIEPFFSFFYSDFGPLDVDGPAFFFWFCPLVLFRSACSLWDHKMLCVDMYGPTCLICFHLKWCGFRLITALIHVFIYLFLGLILNFKISYFWTDITIIFIL
jgi:hypothetical protein